MDRDKLLQQARDRVETARASLMDALDQLDGVDDDDFDINAFRRRVAADVAAGAERAKQSPMLVIALCTAFGVLMGFGAAFAIGKRFIC